MFIDRKDAAQQLAHALSAYCDQHVIVLGIPRGGVETAYYVASYLNADFSLIVARKLGHPENPEAAFGAIAEDGSIYVRKEISETIDPEEIDMIVEAEQKEIQRRIKKLRKGKPLPDMKEKIVIIVDDGIATGATVFTAIALCRKRHPAKLIVAAPIASQRIEYELQGIVDDVIILEKPAYFYAVGQGYRNFANLTDEDTLAFIDAWETRLKTAS